MRLSFRSKLALVFVSLFLVVQGIQLTAFYRTTASNVRAQADAELETASRVFEQLYDYRTRQIQSFLDVFSKDDGFRAAVATFDEDTIISSLENAKGRLEGGAIVAAFDVDGELLGAATGGLDIDVARLGEFLDTDPDSDESQLILTVIDGIAVQFVASPVLAPVYVGWVVSGSVLDVSVAEEIQALSAVELQIAFITQGLVENGALSIAASTASRADLETYLASAMPSVEQPEASVQIAGEEFLRRWVMIDGGQGNARVYALLYTSVAAAYSPYQALVLTIVIVAMVSLAALMLGSYALAQGVSRPIAGLAKAAEKLAGGQYSEVSELKATSSDEIGVLTRSFRQMVRSIRDREDHIRHQARHDPETGLPNRLTFEADMAGQMKTCNAFGLLVVAIGNLQGLRNTLPMDQTTRLIQQVAARLAEVPNAGLASLAYGSFSLILREDDDVDTMLVRLHRLFDRPISVDDVSVDIRLRIGAALYPKDGTEQSTLLRRAHAAADHARHTPNRCAHYTEEQDTAEVGHLSLMSDLRKGMDEGEVKFAYQPKLELQSRKVVASEALVRWISPDRGFVPPDEFIPLAEQTGEVRRLTRWGLEKVINEAARWKGLGHKIQVGFNLSANDLLTSDLPQMVDGFLRNAEIGVDQLYLEITESAVMQDPGKSLEVLNLLYRMGIKLAIDDYGTGYSSLSYLKTLPVQELKIDRAFVMRLAEDEEDRVLVKSTIEMAHALGLQVTAEGVEDETSLKILTEYGCDYAQGYHIARPLPVEDFIPTVEEIEGNGDGEAG